MFRRIPALVWIVVASATLSPQPSAQAQRLNILWITSEDIGQRFGWRSDKYAKTPNLDRLSTICTVFTKAFAHAAMPSLSRAGAITGDYPTSTGAHHVPARTLAPKHLKCVSELLRAAGYYCTNRRAAHYELGPMRFGKDLPRDSWSPHAAWDAAGSERASWRSRPDKSQPFFAIMGHRGKSRPVRHDPGNAPELPHYLPDTPVIRDAIASEYDRLEQFDAYVGTVLAKLKADRLEDNTIVWIFSTNGRDLPREKRWLYDAGTKIPLLVHVPLKQCRKVFSDIEEDTWRLAIQGGRPTVRDVLVSTIDFAPTLLSLAGMRAPTWMRGRAFLGRHIKPAPKYLFAARDRIDEAADCVRSVRDGRFLYLRNHMPGMPYSQACAGQDATPAMQELRRLHAKGKLTGAAARFFQAKPIEELYDSVSDPYQTFNLASVPKHRERLLAMREAQIQWSLETHDVGLIPEVQFNRFKIQKFGILRCPKPLFRLAKDDRGRTAVQIACWTEDSSVIYQVDGRGTAGPNHWNLYTEPVTLVQGQVVTAHGVGIGNIRSLLATFKIGDKQSTAVEMAAERRAPHWTRDLDRTNVLEQLQKLKRRDFTGSEALPGYHESYGEKLTDLRYWSMLAIHRLAKTPAELRAAHKVYVEALYSSSDAVRMAGARFLADVAETKKHRGMVLSSIRHLLSSPNEHGAFVGLQALDRIGVRGAALKPHVVKLLDKISGVGSKIGYLPPPLATSRILCRRILGLPK